MNQETQPNGDSTGELISYMPRLVSLGMLLTLIIVLGITFYRVIAPYILPLFVAGMTAAICQPFFKYVLKRTKNRLHLAAGITTGIILSAIMIPMLVATLIASLQLYAFAQKVTDDTVWQDKTRTYINRLMEDAVKFGNQFLPVDQQKPWEEVAEGLRERVKTVLSDLGDRSLGAASSTMGLLAGGAGMVATSLIALTIFAIALYYFLADGTSLLKATEQMIPVQSAYQRQLLGQFSTVVRSVVMATFLAALAQSVATTAALWFFGFSHLLVLFVLCSFSALIPLAGTWLVWLPCAVILFVNGHPWQAVLLSLYGAIFVGFLDNIVRTYVLNSDTKLHPLLAFISVLGGLQVMGLWGVFIGPIVASCLHALIEIFNLELKQLSKIRAGGEDPGIVTAAPTTPRI